MADNTELKADGPLTIEERLTFLEHLMVMREVAIATQVASQDKNAPEQFVIDALITQYQYLMGLSALIGDIGFRLDDTFKRQFQFTINQLQKTLAEIQRKLQVYDQQAPHSAPNVSEKSKIILTG
jgi:hypothetical protein